MKFYEETLANDLKNIKTFGHTVTPWAGIAEMLKGLGYVVVEIESSLGSVYNVYANPITLTGYVFRLNGKRIFIKTNRKPLSPNGQSKLVNDIVRAIGGSVYDYRFCNYLEKNIKASYLRCDANNKHADVLILEVV